MKFEIWASYRSERDADYRNEPGRFVATAYFETLEEAKECAAKFPKYLKVRAGTLGGRPGINALVDMTVYLTSTGVTGERNEGGIKRIEKFLSLCPNAKWVSPFVNTYPTQAEFLANL